MANVRVESESLNAMAKAIRSKTGKEVKYYPGTMANGVDEVYDKGKSDGYNAGYTEGEAAGHDAGYDEGQGIGYSDGYDVGYSKGFSEGKATGYDLGKSESYSEGFDAGYTSGYDEGNTAGYDTGYQAQYDLFWDTIQRNGTRTDYSYAFANWDYAQAIFKPKYDIIPEGSVTGMFFGANTYFDLEEVCKEQGIVMDFSKVTSFTNFMGNSCSIYAIGEVDCSSVTTLNLAFNMATSLKTIKKLILHEGITTYTNCFANAALLQNITIEGTIAGTGIVLSAHTNLSHDSIMSFINALKDYSGTTTTKTITFGTTNLAKLTDEEKAIATDKGWTLA